MLLFCFEGRDGRTFVRQVTVVVESLGIGKEENNG